MLEISAVMGWFVVLVLGEKFVGDAVTARRAAEISAQESVSSSAMSYCAGSSASPTSIGQAVHSAIDVAVNGKPDLSQIIGIVAGLGLGSQKTFSLYLDPLQESTAGAQSAQVKPHPLVGQGTYRFDVQRTMACLERSKDSPIPDIAEYRNAIFTTDIQGYP
jgi:hypothetical protein